MPVRNRKPPASRRERAADLRARAEAVSAEIAEQARALDERRQANEAGALLAEAVELELEQDGIDRAAELREQADAAGASADDLDRQAEQLNVEMLEAAIRAAWFDRQIVTQVTDRRGELERRSAQAAEAGDADAVMEAEGDLSLLPALESRLQEQADAADAEAARLNDDASAMEERIVEVRTSAAALRHWADTDPLSPSVPPPPASGQATQPRTHLDGGARREAREAALRAVRAMPEPGGQDAAAAVFATTIEAHREARAQALHAQDAAELEELARLVGQVVDAAGAEADRRLHAPMGAEFPALIAGGERQKLEASVADYQARLGRELPHCHDLATNGTFGIVDRRLYPDRFKTDLAEAASAAVEELAAERAALETA